MCVCVCVCVCVRVRVCLGFDWKVVLIGSEAKRGSVLSKTIIILDVDSCTTCLVLGAL